MPKKINNVFYSKLTFEKILAAHKRAKNQKAYKPEIIKFELNLENNITNLINEIKNNKYRTGKYFTFKIYEPKERYIQALPYKDRIVHQWYVEEFIKPYIVPKFINTSYACITDKGAHKAAEKIQNQMRIFQRNYGNFWILKCDIKKYFYNINPLILLNIMKKYFKDKDLINFTQILLFNGPIKKDAVGIPIGNYTSQFFANIYLNELDQYIKRQLKIKNYVRYMDDFILILETKKECILLKRLIEKFLHERLKLELNSKSKYYPAKMGVNFCGYRIFTTHRLLRNSSKKKIKKNIKTFNKLYHNNMLNINFAIQSINSWIGHASHCNSFKLQQQRLQQCDFIWNNKAFQNIENNTLLDIINNQNT